MVFDRKKWAKEYGKKHRDKLRQYYKEYYTVNKEKINEEKRQIYAKNPEEKRKKNLKHYHDNKDYYRKWCKSYKGKVKGRRNTNLRRVRKMELEHNYTKEEWKEKVEQTKGVCPGYMTWRKHYKIFTRRERMSKWVSSLYRHIKDKYDNWN